MAHKSPLQLLIIIFLVAFSFAVPSVAVPASRSLLSIGEEFSRLSMQTTPFQDLVDLKNEEEEIEGRMDLESTDYPGTGANNRHNPKVPARA
ncbi:hypothetical protein QN277_013491 [Acacia crassicarpa]|uniref:Uncharacterized protein n=1 Tax=Acacia crassicarpa TaxID=499986 RepID=A0AAE1N3G1_9FABA|nr:hypothetical protein QN277_013491 [Acacia crassicarpa]